MTAFTKQNLIQEGKNLTYMPDGCGTPLRGPQVRGTIPD